MVPNGCVDQSPTPSRSPEERLKSPRPARLRSFNRFGLWQTAVNRSTTVILALAFTLVGVASATAVSVVLTGAGCSRRLPAGLLRDGSGTGTAGMLMTVTVILATSGVLIVVMRRLLDLLSHETDGVSNR